MRARSQVSSGSQSAPVKQPQIYCSTTTTLLALTRVTETEECFLALA